MFYKTLTSVTMKTVLKKASVFFTVSHFHPNLTFSDKG